MELIKFILIDGEALFKRLSFNVDVSHKSQLFSLSSVIDFSVVIFGYLICLALYIGYSSLNALII